MSEELKPCPFCGSTEVNYFCERISVMNNAFMHGVRCHNCGGAYISSDINTCPNDMYKAWNRGTRKND